MDVRYLFIFHSWGKVQSCLVKGPKLFLIINLYFIISGISKDLTNEQAKMFS